MSEGTLRRAVACVKAMKVAAMSLQEYAKYSTFMLELRERYKHHEVFQVL